MSEAIVDDPDRQRYESRSGGTTAHFEYTRAPRSVTLIHTIVPGALAGQGIGSRLAKFALDDARSRGIKVIVKCSFIEAYVKKHPQYLDLMAVAD